MNRTRDRSDAVVIVVKGFLSSTKEPSDFKEFSSILEKYPQADVVGYDWDSGAVEEIFFSTAISFCARCLINSVLFSSSEKKNRKRRHVAFVLVSAVGYFYRTWRKAKKNAAILSDDLRLVIKENQKKYKMVIVIAHSLGCRLLLNALKERLAEKVDRIFLVAGAIEDNDNLRSLLESAVKVENRFSRNDYVLRWLYRIAELKPTANPIGIAEVACSYIDSVDCTSLNCGHELTPHIESIVHQALSRYSLGPK